MTLLVSEEEIKKVKEILFKNIIPDLCDIIIKYISIKHIRNLPENIEYLLKNLNIFYNLQIIINESNHIFISYYDYTKYRGNVIKNITEKYKFHNNYSINTEINTIIKILISQEENNTTNNYKFYYIKKYEYQTQVPPTFIYDFHNIFGHICIINYGGIFCLRRYEHCTVSLILNEVKVSKNINDLINLLSKSELKEFYRLQRENT